MTRPIVGLLAVLLAAGLLAAWRLVGGASAWPPEAAAQTSGPPCVDAAGDVLCLSLGGTRYAGLLSDGALVVSGTPSDYGLTGGTSPGSVITAHNRFFRSINAAGTRTVRLIGVNNADWVVIGGEPVGVVYLSGQVMLEGLSSAGRGIIEAGDPDTGGQGYRMLRMRN